MHPNVAIVRLSPFGVKLLDALSQPYVKARTQLEETADADGWRIATVPTGKTSWHAATELLRLGAEAEVLEPSRSAREDGGADRRMAARYRGGAGPSGRYATSLCLVTLPWRGRVGSH